MREKKDRITYIVIIVMGLVVITALIFSFFVGSMYVKERDIATEAKNLQIEEAKQEAEIALEQQQKKYTQEEVDVLLDEKEEETKNEMKDLIISLLESNNSSLYMLRYLFQEKLVFTDEGKFYFVDILDSLKKHNYSTDNFVSDNGELKYIENGEAISHKGIDVSKYQGNIDWQEVSEDGVEFAIIRLGVRGYESGKIVLDDYFDQNMKEANEAGILTGVYFFTQAVSEEEAIEEADFVIEHLQEYDVTAPVVFDVEKIEESDGRMNGLTQQERTDITIAFCEKIKEAGYVPMIYGNIKCFGKLLDLTRLEDYQKWFAFYDEYLYYPYSVDMWQYSEMGKVNGIKGNVDINISFHLW